MELFLAPKPKCVEFTGNVYIPQATNQDACNYKSTIFQKELRKVFPRLNACVKTTVRKGLVKAAANAEQAYSLIVSPKGITIRANAEIGALYALQTLKQIKGKSTKIQCCNITDYPDTEWRVCSRPLILAEGTRSALDWGDGRKGFMTRWKQEIDYALSCKYNGIFCYGMTLDTDCWQGYARDMRYLNRYARARGISLIYSIYGMSFGGWGGDNYLGDAHAFVPGAGKNFKQDYICGINNPQKPETGKNGTCRSNNGLWKAKVKDVHNFIKAIEPGALYIHHEDMSEYHSEWELFWSLRCPECRKRWPNDAANAIDGGAGAIARGYDAFGEARKGIKNAHYDAEKDCRLWLTSPAYGSVTDDEATWNLVKTLWINVSKSMKTKDNIFLCIREQFIGEDGKLRVKELSDTLKSLGGHHKLMIFSVSGAALYGENASFSSMPEINSHFEDADGVFNFSGVIYQRPQQLFNCECTWNLNYAKGGETVDARKYDRKAFMDGYIHKLLSESAVSKRHCVPGCWLDKACTMLYGKKAGESIWKYMQLCSEYFVYPLSIVFKHAMMDKVMENITSTFPEKAVHKGLKWLRPLPEEIDCWSKTSKITEDGIKLIHEAIAYTRPGFLRNELIQQEKTLKFGRLFADTMVAMYKYREKSIQGRYADAQKAIATLRKAANSFPKDFMCGNKNGETSMYPVYCDKLDSILDTLKKQAK